MLYSEALCVCNDNVTISDIADLNKMHPDLLSISCTLYRKSIPETVS